jgi:predicted DNA-binding protein
MQAIPDSTTLAIRIPNKTLNRLRILAERDERTIAWLVRKALEIFVEQELKAAAATLSATQFATQFPVTMRSGEAVKAIKTARVAKQLFDDSSEQSPDDTPRGKNESPQA